MKTRKYISIILVMVMMFSLAACGGGDKETDNGASDSSKETLEPGSGLDSTGKEDTAENTVSDSGGDVSWWEGDWYGWWTIFDGDGYYADYINEAWDCCMYFEPMEDHYLITVWDEDYNDYEENCLAEVLVDIDFSSGDGEHGEAVSVADDRNFFWNGSVEAGNWTIDPAYAEYDNMLIIEGSFTDSDGEYCEYGIVLTKWGYEWNEDATYAPDYYEDYFLPLLEADEDLPIIFEPVPGS